MLRQLALVEGRVAVTTSQNFGIIGNGVQYVLEQRGGPGAPLVEVARFDAADGLYDCCWSEENESVLVSASGDGSVKVWDVAAPPMANPLRSLEEHTHEVYAVHWNQVRKDCFLSASWDDTVKLWSLAGPPASLRTFAEHSYCVYAAVWSPQHADIFATASGDCRACQVFCVSRRLSDVGVGVFIGSVRCGLGRPGRVVRVPFSSW